MTTYTAAAVLMYYDEYEKEHGDGFYPVLFSPCSVGWKEIMIEFEFANRIWRQKTEDMIYGLDCEIGSKLLNILNTRTNANGHTIYSYCKKTGCSIKLYETPLLFLSSSTK